jgi:cysteinyl-tRNA synthetase
MSKSLKNIITLREAFKKWGPEPLRLWYLTAHYRKPQVFTEESMEQAVKLYDRLVTCVELLKKLSREASDPYKADEEDLGIRDELVNTYKSFDEALSNDFNTPKAIAAVNRFLNIVFAKIQYKPSYLTVHTAYRILEKYNQILGVLDKHMVEKPEELETVIDELVKIIVEVRRELRKRKLYDLADKIREELSREGIILMDKGL